MLAGELERYLQETLGLRARLESWPQVGKLPYYLKDAYTFHRLELLGTPCIAMVVPVPRAFPLADIRKHLEKVTDTARVPVLLVTEALAFFERKRLIEHKVPFVVPGNQLYLPELGIDLREHFREQRKQSDKLFSPSTQAILIAALLGPWQKELRPIKVAARFGYTAMTASRALGELNAAGIATTVQAGRERWLHIDLPPAEVWEKVRPLMRSPVKQTVWTRPTPELTKVARLAGLSALGRHSMIADPKYPVYAISQEQWKLAKQQGIQPLPEPDQDSCEWQVWSYNPGLLSDAPTVDPLSLMLSLQGTLDERIESALDTLKDRLPW